MNRGQRTIATLLAVVAVMLTLNLIVKESPAAGQAQAAPVQPTVVDGFAFLYGGAREVYRFWSDGTVDYTVKDFSCLPDCSCNPATLCGPIPIITGACTADVTRNGEVEVTDFLEVLGQWGPCNP